MTVELIAIGSELACGASLDTNSQWLSCELEARGWTVTRHTTIADDLSAIVDAFRSAAQRSRIVLITGGLGPTRDDITRDALATAFDQPLVEDAESLRQIEALFDKFGRPMPDRNRVQAMRPRDAEPLANPNGTAPGVLLRLDNPKCLIAAMPGVPREMELMFERQLAPQLPRSPIAVRRIVLRTFGYGESQAEERLGDLTERGRNPEVGITASGAVISLSVTGRADSDEACELLVGPVVEEIRERLGETVFGTGSDQLHEIVRQLLADNRSTIALTEGTVTGGLLSQWLRSDHDQLSTVVNEDSLIPGSHDTSNLLDVCGRLRQTSDFVVATSHARLEKADDSDILMQKGQIAVIGPGLERVMDVDFVGNIGIFHERAARMALNVVRLQLSGFPV